MGLTRKLFMGTLAAGLGYYFLNGKNDESRSKKGSGKKNSQENPDAD